VLELQGTATTNLVYFGTSHTRLVSAELMLEYVGTTC